VKAESVWTITS